MKTYKIFISTVIILSVIISCGKKNPKNSTNSETVLYRDYIPTSLPKDTTKLWIEDSNIEKDTVLIVGEGGPKGSLDFQSNGRIYWEYLNNYNNYKTLVIHQSSTYNPTIFNAKKFTLADGYKEADISAEILYRAIKYYKNRNKYVIVAGHSYSAFIIPYYIASRPSLADKYLITGGRLNADSIQTYYQLKGYNSGFKDDGKTLIIPDTTLPRKQYRTERYFKIRNVKEMLKAGIGNYKFTDKLKDKDLSNIIFFYGKYDENVGALSKLEIDFLESKNVKVFGVETNHYRIWQRVIDSARAGKIKL
ncbi:MAG: hypothetical protein EVB11_10255 [Winogradskyella sp.]|nr:MAG: hypothetical protein EVB11_10255 [Winogradskyella sp.]